MKFQAQLIWQERKILHKRGAAVNPGVPSCTVGPPDGPKKHAEHPAKGGLVAWDLVVCFSGVFLFSCSTNISRMLEASPGNWLGLLELQKMARFGQIWVQDNIKRNFSSEGVKA